MANAQDLQIDRLKRFSLFLSCAKEHDLHDVYNSSSNTTSDVVVAAAFSVDPADKRRPLTCSREMGGLNKEALVGVM